MPWLPGSNSYREVTEAIILRDRTVISIAKFKLPKQQLVSNLWLELE
jgi:hypothetical protein